VRLLGKKTRFVDLRRGYSKPSVYHLSRQKLPGSRLGRLLESGPSIDAPLTQTPFFGVCDFPAWWPQLKRASPCSPSLHSLNTETTEDLSDLCVKFFLLTEDTEASPATCRSEQNKW
jgi:hypothetical protein